MTDERGRVASYPSIYNAGHGALVDLLSDPVLVEEKIDGSQFSFGMYGAYPLELRCRSSGQQIVIGAHPTIFDEAMETVLALRDQGQIVPQWTYRCEYLKKPKHHTTAYGRIPTRHLMVFDIETGLQTFLSYSEKAAEARALGLEVVPRLFEGHLASMEQARALIPAESVLGGVAEGIVVKNYRRFGADKKMLCAKVVRDGFQEENRREWRAQNPTRADVVHMLIAQLRTVPRWQKAIQRLRERGEITDTPRDIAALLTEVPHDVLKECEGLIHDALFAYAWPQIKRGITAGLPEWYKQQLTGRAVRNHQRGSMTPHEAIALYRTEKAKRVEAGTLLPLTDARPAPVVRCPLCDSGNVTLTRKRKAYLNTRRPQARAQCNACYHRWISKGAEARAFVYGSGAVGGDAA